jgi:hypothetical protein
VSLPRRTPVATVLLVVITLALIASTAQAAGSRAGATHVAERHTIAYVKRFGIVLRARDLEVQCSIAGRSRWRGFVYANGGQCAGTLTEVYSTRTHASRARSIEIGSATPCASGPKRPVLCAGLRDRRRARVSATTRSPHNSR